MKRERTEWCDMRWFHADDETLPRALLIGDSIVVGYSTRVQDKLNGRWHIARLATSKCVGDAALLRELDCMFADYAYDVVHFNNGLHGWSFSEPEYRDGLAAFLEHLTQLAGDAKLVWASTTPVRDQEKQLQPERNARVLARNQIAQELIMPAGIPTNDLYGLMLPHPNWCTDGVHYNAQGYGLMADVVAETILSVSDS